MTRHAELRGPDPLVTLTTRPNFRRFPESTDLSAMQLVGTSETPPFGLEQLLNELGAGDSRFSGTSFGRGECDLKTFLRECSDSENEIHVPDGKVPQSTRWLVDGQGQAVGIVRVRHRLNERLSQFGGHIGYYVKPSERRKGYGTMALRLGLDLLRERGETMALVTVHPSNQVSKKVILANGGTPDGYGQNPESGEIVERYWINL